MKIENKVFTEEKLKTVLDSNSEEAQSTINDEDKFERLVQRLEIKLKLVPGIGKYISDIACMVSLVRSYIKKEYTDIPIGTIISIVSTLIYILSPVDLIPDYIPVVGYLDDLALLSWVLKLIHSDVEEYKKWRIENNKQIVEEI
ncbi:uncharacterized membrane protein YkvA (DUF1232 family) [Clostridium saccharoperbutylacetonicum]|uniref:PF06803 family protein n=1 Tax=Clostridium saccharoperbutylacetonicum N1-4(HMT) TaxID=931276 RepID=M1MRN8_9CLOT|nr:DUF1232 domain-containing protein [Clostridium saccharoperbutylacetonicum]AGF57416.1 PF06803 family protein [Clostridium saccharoperbutylacetonicum N1-4(HMT)]NRT61819.1 uncharacterized membrane protein YkvA (DUF1232 family) [Clostridium saccharoperbutylacetonicum]NSB25145.1 uncharacterized membrane protein YkvA (DUF1232 family) [Clostridium saccharoperbutylacetonicum]NSB44515.1 uncharacterized membrane protein YkvA (DUF1232 family) [Clostridium saccharoperbutylacetonicum]